MDAIYYQPKKRKKARKILLWIFGLIFLIGTAYGAFFIYKIYSTGKKVNEETGSQTSLAKTLESFTIGNKINLRSSNPDRINILLLGIAGKGKPGQNLTDTIMIASLNTKTGQVALLSIPRDFYVKIPDNNFQTKINSVYQYGISNSGGDGQAADSIIRTVENITSLTMDYYVILNFDGFEKIINSIGGINIMNERDIFDPRYPGPNYSYETFELSKGFHHLDGATALKYARERHNDPEGDFGRAKRQQQIMETVKNKVFSAGTLLNPIAINNLFDALGENIVTNITAQETGDFIELAKKMDTRNINNLVLDAWNKDSLLKVSHVFYGNVRAFALVPRVGNFSEIHDLAQNIFDLNEIKRKREEIAKEGASIAIVNQSDDTGLAEKIRKLLNVNFGYKNVSAINSAKNISSATTAYDLTDGKKPFTLNELAAKLPASVSYEASEDLIRYFKGNNPDIILILGKDLATMYNMEEGTLEDLNNAREEEYLNLNNQ